MKRHYMFWLSFDHVSIWQASTSLTGILEIVCIQISKVCPFFKFGPVIVTLGQSIQKVTRFGCSITNIAVKLKFSSLQ